MTWNDFLDKVYQGAYHIFTFIPAEKINMLVGTDYYIVMIGIWLVIFFTIWLTLFVIYKIFKIIFG